MRGAPILLTLLGMSSPSPALAGEPPAEISPAVTVERAEALVDALGIGRFDTAVEPFNDALRETLTQGKLRQRWLVLLSQNGAFRKRGASRRETNDDGVEVVSVVCRFSRGNLDARVTFDEDGRVSGLLFLPSSAGEE